MSMTLVTAIADGAFQQMKEIITLKNRSLCQNIKNLFTIDKFEEKLFVEHLMGRLENTNSKNYKQ